MQSCKPGGIAGRRVAKVVATLEFIADHIANMTELTSANETGRDFMSATMAKRRRERVASAPQTAAGPSQVSPYDIDALLA